MVPSELVLAPDALLTRVSKTRSVMFESYYASLPRPAAAQLTAFASGERHNDINGQMRAMARGLKPEEIAQAAAHYSETKK
jgi:hypothetical protein